MASVGGLLRLKVCSARNLNNDKTMHPLVQVTVGDSREKTGSRKCSVGQKTVYWNQQFKFKVRPGDALRLEVKNKDSILRDPQRYGMATMLIPEGQASMIDTWIPVLDPISAVPIPGEVHCVMQFQPDGTSAPPGVVVQQLPVGVGSSGSRSMQSIPVRPPGEGPLISAPINHAQSVQLSASPTGGGAKASHGRASTIGAAGGLTVATSPRAGSFDGGPRAGAPSLPPPNSASSQFDGHAAALTINELMNSLELVKGIIEAHANGEKTSGPVVVQNPDPERLNALRNARNDLENIQSQIAAEESLSDDWRAKLVNLAAAYATDLSVLLSAEAWQDLDRRRSNRLSARALDDAHDSLLGGDDAANDEAKAPMQEHVETTKAYVLESLELFDQLLDNGFAVEIEEPGTGDDVAMTGCLVRLDYVVYIWDSVQTIAVSFAASADTGPLEFIVGDEDFPAGLSDALVGMRVGTRFNVCIAPSMAYGEAGNEQVPPDTHVMYEATLLSVGTARDLASENPAAAQLRGAQPTVPAPAERAERVRGNRSSMRFPARQNRVSLAASLSPGKENGPLSGDPLPPTKPSGPVPAAPPVFDPPAGSTSSAASTPPPLPPRSDYPFRTSTSVGALPQAPTQPPPPSLSSSYRQPQQQQQQQVAGALPVPPRPVSVAVSEAPQPLPLRKPRLPPRASSSNSAESAASSAPSSPRGSSKQMRAEWLADKPSVTEWLEGIGCEQFATALKDLGVETVADLPLLQTEDLKGIGFRVIHIRKFMQAVADLGPAAEKQSKAQTQNNKQAAKNKEREKEQDLRESLKKSTVRGHGDTMMRAAQVARLGVAKDVLSVRDDVPRPTRTKGKVLVKVLACSLHAGDRLVMSGQVSLVVKPKAFPYVPGGDLVGVVEEADADSELKVGDTVVGSPDDKPFVGLAEYAVLDEWRVTKKPDSVSVVQAAALPVSGATALDAVSNTDIPPNARVLVLGASGGVGTFLTQVLRSNSNVGFLAATSSDQPLVESFKVDRFINYREENWWEIEEFRNNKFDIIFDPVGGNQHWKKAHSVLKSKKQGGTFVAIALDNPQIKLQRFYHVFPLMRVMLGRSIAVSMRPGTHPKYQLVSSKLKKDTLPRLLDLATQGKIRSVIENGGEPFPFTQEGVVEAFSKLESGHAHGKVVIRVAEP
ncbi:NADPH-dependent alkenal/one oxidoreductase [Durusdinium trenchii]|uniref:peptidylprolyl isomerase n=1 Tax=Durusdinium trenchii TaxID=1381693 RepID=A0ABP0K7U2_9DINO